jgi:hypothetical protein
MSLSPLVQASKTRLTPPCEVALKTRAPHQPGTSISAVLARGAINILSSLLSHANTGPLFQRYVRMRHTVQHQY